MKQECKTQNDDLEPEVSQTKRKHKKCLRVIMEIAFMALGVLCSVMPQPFPLLVPIGIGAIRIISSAVRSEKAAEAPPVKVYCNGVQEPHESPKPKQTGKPAKEKAPAGKRGNGKR